MRISPANIAALEPHVDAAIRHLHRSDIVVQLAQEALAETAATRGENAEHIPVKSPLFQLAVAVERAKENLDLTREMTADLLSALGYWHERALAAEQREERILDAFIAVHQKGDISSPSVYFIQAERTNMVKIGFSTNVAKRLRSLQTACSTKVRLLVAIPGNREAERAYHEQFSRSREQGEWFRPTADILAEVSRLQGGDA